MSFGVCMIYLELWSAPPVNQPVCAPGVGDFSVCKAYLSKNPGICFFFQNNFLTLNTTFLSHISNDDFN